MRAKIAAVTNQKGGSGKTNVSVNVAGTGIRHGYKVLLVDADKQATATQWISNADPDSTIRIPVMGLHAAGAKITQEIKKYVDDYDLIIVDCPPAVDSPIPQAMMLIADLAIVPIIPNPGDLWAAAPLLELAERSMGVNDVLKVCKVASLVRPNLAMTKKALEQIQQMKPEMALLRTQINLRTAYPEAMISGDSVHALGTVAKAAIKEIESMYLEIMNLLGMKGTK